MTDYLLIQALNGLVIGIIYAVIAAGLTVIFSILKIVNFAHGEVYMMGGYFAYFAIALAGIPPLPAVLVAMALSFRAVGAGRAHAADAALQSHHRTQGRLRHSGHLRHLDLPARAGADHLRSVPAAAAVVLAGRAVVGDLVMAWDRVFAGGAGIAMLIGLVWFMNRTPWGEALNAVSQSRESAAIVGINDQRFYMLAFGLGGALAGGAGALVGPIYSLSPSMGLLPDTQAFAIVILGGMGSVAGSILAGLLIGVSESMFVALFPDPSRSLTYAQAFSLLILMLVLLIRPTGLFGRAHVAME